MRGFTLFLFLILLSPSVFAQACNGVWLKDVTGNYSFNSASEIALTFKVARGNSSSCQYFIGFNKGWSQLSNSRAMYSWNSYFPYEIYADSNHSHVIREAGQQTSPSNFILGSFPSGTPQLKENTHTYYMKLLPDYLGVEAGYFTDVVTMILYEGNPSGSYRTLQAWNLVHTYNAQATAHLSLVDSGAPLNLNDTNQTLNFGVLSPGVSRGFDILTTYNTGYRLYASSLHGGRLKHQSGPQQISYSFKINGQTLSLTNSSNQPIKIAEGNGKSPSGGKRHNVLVTIGSFSQAVAGAYSDVVTLTVESKE